MFPLLPRGPATIVSVVTAMVLVLFSASPHEGCQEGDAAATVPALLPVVQLAGGGQAGKGHCRTQPHGGGHDGTSPQARMAATMVVHCHRPGWQQPQHLTTLGKNCLYAVLMFFLNICCHRGVTNPSNWTRSVSIFRAIIDCLMVMVEASSSFPQKLPPVLPPSPLTKMNTL